MRVVDPRTGIEETPSIIGVYIAASPAVVNDKVYVGDYDGVFYCLDILQGGLLWQNEQETAGSILGIRQPEAIQ
jgi:outer membrane protein assembly factor BamB